LAGAGGGRLRPWEGVRLWNLKPADWRTAAWLGALLLAGVILLFAHPAGAPAPGTAAAPGGGASGATAALPTGDPLRAEEAAMDADLERILGRIAGVGAVSVQVHLAYGPVTDFATDTQVSESGGGAAAQSSESDQVVLAGSGAPAVRAVQAPQVDGVLVVAQGASDPRIALELTQAVEAATGAAAYAIVVLPGGGGG
jgi:stage III sporulation protein AG